MRIETSDFIKSKSLKGIINGSFVIFGFFIILSFGIASFVLYYKDGLIDKVFTLILIFAFFILFIYLIVFSIIYFSFYYLVNDNYKKLYEDLCKKEEDYYKKQKFKVMDEVCLIIEKTINQNTEKNLDAFKERLIEMINEFLKTSI